MISGIKNTKGIAMHNPYVRIKNSTSGITLVALVVTIIVLLILAGVSIATLAGENGILTRASGAKDANERAEADERIKLVIADWVMEKISGNKTISEYLENKKTSGEIDDWTDNGDGTYEIEINGYVATIDEDGNIIEETAKAGGIKAVAEYEIYQTNGNAIVDGTKYENLAATIKITNKNELGTIDSIIMKDSNGNEKEKQTSVIGDSSADASFIISNNGTYTVTIKTTTDGIPKVTTLKVTVSGKIQVAEFSRYSAEGKIEVVWIDQNNKIISNPEAPVLLGNMKPLKLNSAGTDFETTTQANWGYNYVAGTGTTTNTNSYWANAQTTDTSMWVWIPRYAYKITYYDTDGTTILGYSCARGIVNTEGGVVEENAEGIQTVGDYIVHPAFTENANTGGGFGKIKGLWVAKFETTGSITTPSVIPEKSSVRSQTINAMYKAGKTATFGETQGTLQNHMMKNSEWGACVYLAHSQYGTNGAKIDKNTSSSYYVGGSNTKATIYTTNVTQSTTHNPYGVYDLNGGAYEYVASYVNNGASNLTTYGGTTSSEDLFGTEGEQGTSTAYKTVYSGTGSASADYSTNSNVRGDAVYETSKSYSISTGSWFLSTSGFPDSGYPFFLRGGYCYSSSAGSFFFNGNTGVSDSGGSFRVVLAP